MNYMLKMKHPPKQLRAKSTEISHFKVLVVFVFAVYGILIPLWFAFHGNDLFDNNDSWKNIVISSTRVARSQSGSAKKDLKIGTRLTGLKVTRRRKYPNVTRPKPLYTRFNYLYWPRPHAPQNPKFQSPKHQHHKPKRRKKVKQNSGRLLVMKWEHLCCQSINCLRKFPLFPLLPSKKRFLRRLKVSEKGRLYGQRIAGLLKPPESGSYSFYVKCLSTCEFWLSDNEYPLHSKLRKKVVRGSPVKHGLKVNNTISWSLVFKTPLQAGRAYFMDILLTVYRYTKRPLEVLWKLPSGKSFIPLSSEYLAGFRKAPKSLRDVLKLYSHSPSVRLTPFLESIEEPGDDDDDFTTLGGKNHNMNYTFMDSQGHPIPVNSSLRNENTSLLSSTNNGRSALKKCGNATLSFVKKTKITIKNYSGVWKTAFSSVFPRDTTDHMACIGNRYPADCEGNRVISRNIVTKVLTLYSKALSDSKTRNQNQQNKVKEGLKIHQIVSIHRTVDTKNGSLLLVDATLTNTSTNKTYRDFRYLYMDSGQSSLCIPQGYAIKWDVTVNVIVVAKKQTSWLRHFLANLEKIFVKTNDEHMNVIIAKYGNDNEELMEEYQSNRLPSIRMVRHRSLFDKRRAIQSAVKKIKDPNSIIFLMDLHIIVPDTIIQLVRKHTIQGQMVFNPVLFRLSHCGSPASSKKPPRGFWETFGYGILGIYKSDWDNLGHKKTKKYKKGWGGEDWELLDRVLTAGLRVQRLRVKDFYHFHHTKKGMWN